MKLNFADKRILVVGGTRGIGLATARAFLNAGGKVAINGRSSESVQKGILQIGGGERLVAAPGDIGAVSGCEEVVETAVNALGGLDVLVNSAGVGYGSSIEEGDEAFYDSVMNVNLKGTYFCCRAALSALRANAGNIVNVASIAGLAGAAGISIYCASKGGVVQLTRALSAELAPDVRVNCVCPGYVDTDMVRRDWIDKAEDPATLLRDSVIDFAPLRRIGQPEEIAASVLYLASDQAGFMTGAALTIDGGASAKI